MAAFLRSGALLSAFLVVQVWGSPVFAQNSKPEETACLGVISAGEESKPRLMRVGGTAQRVNFLENRSTKKPFCPSEVDACQRKGFVVPGDAVIAAPTVGGMICVSYIAPNAKQAKGVFPETSGFLAASTLQPVVVGAPKPGEWLGSWTRSAEGEIEITQGEGGKLKVLGSATFGSLDPGRVKRGAVNGGELDGQGVPKGNVLALGDGYDGTKPLGVDFSECRAKVQLFERYLVVEDNFGCGGMNVSFTGIYIQLK